MASWATTNRASTGGCRLTADLRKRLRAAIDTEVRARLPEPQAACRGCGVETYDHWSGDPVYLTGCRTCSERRFGRLRRERQHDSQLVLLSQDER